MKTLKGPRTKLEKKAANLIVRKINQLSRRQDKVVLGVPGGRSVRGIFKLLKTSKIPWNKVHVFMVDERRVPITNKESNFNLAKKYFPEQSLHPYYYTRPITDYTNDLKAHGGRFDIIILSSGEDCHVASLFPEKSIKDNSSYFIKIDDAPKPPKKRMTSSRKLLERSQMVILLFFGESKKKAYKKFKDKKVSISNCPSKLVYNIKETYVLVTS